MPTISAFYGILIQMFWDDHAPPHFHVRYAEYKAVIDIETLSITAGKLPSQAQRMVKEWAQQYKAELLNDWELCCANQTPKPIKPLD